MNPCRPLKQRTPPSLFSIGIFALAAALLAGCGHHQNRSSDSAPQLHVDTPPHGGTPVALGGDYQIEWVLDAPSGLLQAYVLDGEMENFVRIAAPSFELKAKLPSREEVLHFAAVANTATGETVGSTALFEARADWLKTNKTFDAVLPAINVEGTVFTNVAFNFPKGNGKE
jgi:hypothetical protein